MLSSERCYSIEQGYSIVTTIKLILMIEALEFSALSRSKWSIYRWWKDIGRCNDPLLLSERSSLVRRWFAEVCDRKWEANRPDKERACSSDRAPVVEHYYGSFLTNGAHNLWKSQATHFLTNKNHFLVHDLCGLHNMGFFCELCFLQFTNCYKWLSASFHCERLAIIWDPVVSLLFGVWISDHFSLKTFQS